MNLSYSFGIIDFFHFGHMRVMKEAKVTADLHIFGLVSDEAAAEWIGRTISNYEERKAVMESVRYVDEVIMQKTLDPLENIKLLHERYPSAKITVYHGNDWKIMPAKHYLSSIGGDFVLTEYYEKMSPDKILDRLSSRNLNRNDGKNLISTKADTLLALKEKLNYGYIEDIYVLSKNIFLEDPQTYCSEIRREFSNRMIVIRSSSSNEDCFELSNAGHYDSLLNINPDNIEEVKNAVFQVIKSYENDGLDGDQQILIQSQTESVIASGVVFTRDIKSNRPYYVINYSDDGSTDYVTSGRGGKTTWISRDRECDTGLGSWRKLIRAVKEVEELLPGMILDIEFALTKDGKVVIFQVRPLAANYKFTEQHDDDKFFEIKNELKKQYHSCISAYSNMAMMLSDMAFWNPSEIIGENPKNLSFSLYREIITGNEWNSGLIPIGYNEVARDLMYRIGNKPYISLDYSFMSLIPSEVGCNLSLKLVEFYKSKLQHDLTAHDKIEFEIAVTCFDHSTEERLNELLISDFSEDEVTQIKDALHILTYHAIKNYQEVLTQDLQDIHILEQKRRSIEQRVDKTNIPQLLGAIRELTDNLKTFGTPQFSRQARYAFIAKSICRSLEAYHYVSSSDIDQFFNSISTIASELNRDMDLFSSGLLSKTDFVEKYGHLRTGTYDITSLPYSHLNFSAMNQDSASECKAENNFVWDDKIIAKALSDLTFEIPNEVFINFLKKSFEQREYFKYVFTKSLSLMLEIIAGVGGMLDIGRDELAYLDLADVQAAIYYNRQGELKEFWTAVIKQRKNDHETNTKIVLPEVLICPDNIDIVNICEARPNFITDKSVKGEIVLLEKSLEQDVRDKIVVITKADPGFDWIFTRDIKGLITKYGGVASHMSIRCAEFEIPAAIGCGEKIYDYVYNAKEILLDCKNKKILEVKSV